MKKCRTLNGLLKAIDKGESAVLEYTNKSKTEDGYIVYLKNGTNLIIKENTHEIIKNHLQKI